MSLFQRRPASERASEQAGEKAAQVSREFLRPKKLVALVRATAKQSGAERGCQIGRLKSAGALVAFARLLSSW